MDVVFKGFDFLDIQYVINYDMFVEIENYVYRIGCIGRCGKIGIVIFFINKNQSEMIFLDLKYLLKEVK